MKRSDLCFAIANCWWAGFIFTDRWGWCLAALAICLFVMSVNAERGN